MKNANKFVNGISYERSAGILMPMFSLPSQYGIGDMGKTARDFIDMLYETKQTMWALLPLSQTGYCNSPYKAVSAFAGNPYFISPEILVSKQLITSEELKNFDFGNEKSTIDYGKLFENRYKMLKIAYTRQKKRADYQQNISEFRKHQSFWLRDYCLYMSLKEHFHYRPWNEWDENIKRREKKALTHYKRQLNENIKFWEFVQYEYFCQYSELKAYASLHKVKFIGDMPFYIEYDSADVWSHKEWFMVEEETGTITLSAGVPGDEFSKLSRNWGMPCYNWQNIAKSKYKWHLERFKTLMQMYDIIRIDHAIGYVRYYGIANTEEKWYEGPDYSKDTIAPKITKLAKETGCEIIAEDLGSVPERAYQLFNKYNWLATRVLQFGFTNQYGTETIHLPFYYPHKSVAYTGTQDNQTLKSYLSNMEKNYLPYMRYYLKINDIKPHNIQRKIIEELYKSASEKVIIPLPDILELDNQARISFGKDYEKSWKWRLVSLSSVTANKKKWLKKMTFAYARTPFSIEQGEKYGWIFK